MKIMCLKNTKKRCSIGKRCLSHCDNSKHTTFSSIKGTNCETLFPCCAILCEHTAISGLRRLIFEAY